MPAYKKSTLARMRRNGLPAKAIAEHTGTTASQVRAALRAFGIDDIKPSRPPRAKPRAKPRAVPHGAPKPRIEVREARQEVRNVVPRAWFQV